MIPYKPVSYEKGVPIFCATDVEDYGPPDLYGVEYFFVSTAQTYSWSNSSCIYNAKEIHRYSRYERFKKTFCTLLSYSGRVLPEIYKEINVYWWNKCSPDKVWEDLRWLIKKCGYKLDFNLYPRLLRMLGYQKIIKFDSDMVQDVLDDFKRISYNFDNYEWKERKYFPCMRFVSLKYIGILGEIEYNIPLVRTARKIKVLQDVWNKIY